MSIEIEKKYRVNQWQLWQKQVGAQKGWAARSRARLGEALQLINSVTKLITPAEAVQRAGRAVQ